MPDFRLCQRAPVLPRLGQADERVGSFARCHVRRRWYCNTRRCRHDDAVGGMQVLECFTCRAFLLQLLLRDSTELNVSCSFGFQRTVER